ncbi:MAG: histidine phosphatase family protein [Propionibacteriaceae bacterium]|jgi:probable phosphoglycerate mutase|nr:histidine phosphatase family protein [Propionibacteriaceae bacterium]
MRLILARHGRTASNTGHLIDTGLPGADLDQVGRRQALALRDRLGRRPIQAVYASSLVRSQQTAEPLAQALGLPVLVLDGLREISAGQWDQVAVGASGQPNPYTTMLLAWLNGDRTATVPGGETVERFLARFEAALATVAAAGPDLALVVSHASALAVWCSSRLAGFAELSPAAWFGHVGHIEVAGAAPDGLRLVDSSAIGGWSPEPACSQPTTPAASAGAVSPAAAKT